MDWAIRDSIPGRCRDFFLLPNIQTSSGDHPTCYSVGIGVLSLEVKWLSCEAEH
jgi:hypothetical protein